MDTEQKYEDRARKLIDDANDLVDKLENVDIEKFTPADFVKWLKRTDELIEEMGDLRIEMEVEDFLTNGPGIKNKNI